MIRYLKVIVSAYFIFLAGCGQLIDKKDDEVYTPPDATAKPAPTKPPVPAELLTAAPNALCGRLSEIKIIPHRDPTVTDPIYDALIAKGDDVIPCLVDKITDKTLMQDPREAPTWQYYAVGDTAVFLLIDILRDNDAERAKLLIEMLPKKYKEEWKTNGVYAYFNYVSEPTNRRELQSWWKNWLKENRKRK